MAHTSLYRKWRPQTFAEVTGQEHVVQTLTNALAQGRIAHAYLFSGPRGTGKTTVARLLAKGLNCAQGPTAAPCGECPSCQRIARGNALDVLEIDGASNRGIDEIREVRENIRFAPAEGRYRVYIIDEVHMLTTEAFNALLKVLEEPPAHGVFVFATTEAHKVPPTILSRCQRFDFRPLSSREIAQRLELVCREEGIDCEPAAIDLIARHADGGLRDALSILDQCSAFGSGRVTARDVEQVVGSAPRELFPRLGDMMLRQDAAEAFRLVRELRSRGKDLRQFARDATRYFRDLMVLASAAEDDLSAGGWLEDRGVLSRQANALGLPRILEALDVLLKAEAEMRWAGNPQFILEAALVRLACFGRAAPAAGASQAPASTPAPAPVPGPASPAAPGSPAAPKPAPLPGPAPSPSGQAAFSPGPAASAPPSPQPDSASKPGSPAAGPGEPQDVLSSWNQIIEHLRRERRIKTLAFVVEGRPLRVEDGDVLVLAYPPDRKFHRANFERGDHRLHLERAIQAVTGRTLKVRTEVLDEQAAAAEEQVKVAEPVKAEETGDAGSPSPPAGEERPGAAGRYPAAVEEVLRLFGGRVVGSEGVEPE